MSVECEFRRKKSDAAAQVKEEDSPRMMEKRTEGGVKDEKHLVWEVVIVRLLCRSSRVRFPSDLNTNTCAAVGDLFTRHFQQGCQKTVVLYT